MPSATVFKPRPTGPRAPPPPQPETAKGSYQSGVLHSTHARWPLCRAAFFALDAHLSMIGAAAFLLPLASMLRIIVPPVALPARRYVNPYSRACLGAIQGCLRLVPSLMRAIHPGALVYLARHAPIGPPAGTGSLKTPPSTGRSEALPPSQSELPLHPVSSSFLDAGDKCFDLILSSPANVGDAREQANYFYALIKWCIALGIALVGWLCLTDDEAPLLLSPLWPTAIVLEGSYVLISAAIAVHEAALEAVLQSYCTEASATAIRATAAADASAAATKQANTPSAECGSCGGTDMPVLDRLPSPGEARAAAARAASLFGCFTTASNGTSGPPGCGSYGAIGASSTAVPYPQLAAYEGPARSM